MSSYRDIEQPLTEIRIFFEEGDPKPALREALAVVGVEAEIQECEIPDEDWKFAYRRHFKTEAIGSRLVVVPEWEYAGLRDGNAAILQGREPIVLDPGMAFGTGKHETTRACLEFIDGCANEMRGASFLDMGCGSGILSIAAAKLGFASVSGFDVDQEAVDASVENAGKNGVEVEFFKYGLGAKVRRALPQAELVAANILGPLLIRFADEIVPCAGRKLIISGILTEIYPEVLAAYTERGFREVSRKTIGEWTTGLLENIRPDRIGGE